MTGCPTCDRRVHNHSYCLKCCNCLQLYHLKCVTLNKDEQNILLTNKEIWICLKCNTDIFPFNNIEEDVEFLQACQTSSQNELLTSTLIYNPFQSNENDYIIGSEFDPDLNFYCEQNIFSGFLCKYFTDESFNEKLSSLSSEDVLSFSLCHINIRSIKANLGDFDNYMRMLNLDFSIIGVTETWLNDINYDLYGLDGYELIERHRANKMGGGIGLFVRNGVSYKSRADLTTFEYYCESLFIEIDKSVFGSGRNILIGVIYRPPNTDIKLFIDHMKEVLEYVQTENKVLYLVGDYNINLLNVDSHNLTADFNDTIYSYGLIPLITRPTRVTETSATLIDNIFTNKNISYGKSMYGILVSDISDHYSIFCVETILKSKSIIMPFLKRDFSEKNKMKFLDVMSGLDWEDIYSAANTQCAFSLFHSNLIDAHHRCFPEKSFTRTYHIRKPWLTSCLRDAIRKKNKLYYKSVKIKCIRTKREYEVYRNQLRKLMRAAEKKYYTDQIMENKQNSKKLWLIIKHVINKNKRIKFQDKSKLNDGSYTTDMKIICEKFNDFFINVGPSLSKKIPMQNCSPDQYIKMKAVYSLYLEPVT